MGFNIMGTQEIIITVERVGDESGAEIKSGWLGSMKGEGKGVRSNQGMRDEREREIWGGSCSTNNMTK